MAFFRYNNGVSGFFTDAPIDSLMELLIDKTRIAGHMLTFNEANADPTMVDPNVYAFYFGGCFSDVSKMAWSRVCEEKKQEEDAMNMPRYNLEIVKDALRNYYIKHKHWPTRHDIDNSRELPSYSIILRYCGGKSQWGQLVFGDNFPIELAKLPVSDTTQNSDDTAQDDESIMKQDDGDISDYEDYDTQVDTIPVADNNEPTAAIMTDDEIDKLNEAKYAANIASDEEADGMVDEPKYAANIVVRDDIDTTTDKTPTTPHQQPCNCPTSIELKITLPDRENPIIVSLSF